MGWFNRLYAILLSILLVSVAEAGGGEYLVYVGTYTGNGSEGIYCYRFDPTNGDLQSLGLVARTENPSFLVADPKGRFLYSVNEVDTFKNQPTGAVSAFSIDKGSGGLQFLQQVPSLGGGPAHISLDRTARFCLVANYGGGNVAVLPISSDGRLGRSTAFMQAYGSSVNRQRQAAPHAHCIQVTPDNRLAIVADLGVDKLLVYDFEESTGVLTGDSLKVRVMEPGAGPRHIAVLPSGKFVYVVNELASSVTVFSYEPSQGALENKQTLSTLPGDFSGVNSAAEIIIDPRGRFLYVSNRGDDSIVAFHIDAEDGRLEKVQRVSCAGKAPRNIALDPSGRWLFSANQKSDGITLFRVNPDDGRLTQTSRSLNIVSPVCVLFVAE